MEPLAQSRPKSPGSPSQALPDDIRFREELAIRDLLANHSQAVREGDIERMMSFYAPNVVAFDMPPPFRVSGVEDYKAVQERWFISQFEFPMTYEIQDPQVFVGGDVAFAFCSLHIAGNFRTDNVPVENWLRQTCGFKKINDEWKITHEHVSAPVGEDGQSLMDLDPAAELH